MTGIARRSLWLAVVVFVGACSGGGSPRGDAVATVDGAPGGLAAAVASFDLAVGPPSRFIVGLYRSDQANVGYGTVGLAFSYLGADRASGRPRPGPRAVASFLPLPGFPSPPAGAEPTLLRPSQGRGVYAADAGFDRAGFWQVVVTAKVAGAKATTASAAFEVMAHHAVPVAGDLAPPSENLTVGTAGPASTSLDSRASGEQPVPDPELHQTTIAEAVRSRVPALVVFSTPTFCVSRFCGPVTDMVAELAHAYQGRARFIHVEIWKDFEGRKLNAAAAEWLARDGADGAEPWVFLIGADGRVAARWDNVAPRDEVESTLAALPPLPAG